MIPNNLKLGGGVSDSIVNPLVLLVVLVTGALICFLPRQKAIAPFLAASILIPMDQVLVLGSLHFTMLRVLAMFGFARLITTKTSGKGNIFSGGISALDKAFIVLQIWKLIAGLLLWQNTAALVFQLGEIYTAFGTYFLLRYLVRNDRDVRRVISTLAWVVIGIAIVMSIEAAKGWNPYALLGGARAAVYNNVMERAGHFRAMGPFGHPIIAGTVGAILVPLFCSLFLLDKKYRAVAVLGIAGATVISSTSGSSTPLIAYGFGILALCLWPLRNNLRIVRWGIVIALVSLHLVMKAPVWHLIARIDLTGGSSSYHRFMLVDQFIRHFGDWWFVGTKSNANWGWDMWDTANQYVETGQNSGLLAFAVFITVLVYGFKYLGRARRAAVSRSQAKFFWAIGAALMANVVAFFGISYWDQSIVVWYALLAIIAGLASPQTAQRDAHKVRFSPPESVFRELDSRDVSTVHIVS